MRSGERTTPIGCTVYASGSVIGLPAASRRLHDEAGCACWESNPPACLRSDHVGVADDLAPRRRDGILPRARTRAARRGLGRGQLGGPPANEPLPGRGFAREPRSTKPLVGFVALECISEPADAIPPVAVRLKLQMMHAAVICDR